MFGNFRAAVVMINLDIKPEVSHLEDTKTDIDLVKAPILKSDLDTLTAWQTVKRFWKVSLDRGYIIAK